jgi:hypothetical protein
VNKKNKEKDKEIKIEIEKLKDIYSDLEGQRRKIAAGIIEEIAFLKVSLRELKEIIKEEGFIDIMPQGNYEIKREAPAVQSYNKLLQKYSRLTKDIVNLLPDEADARDEELDIMEQFANSRPD